MKKILVTGASSALGKSICEKFLKEGNKVIGTFNSTFPSELLTFKNFEPIKVPFDNSDAINQLPNQIDALIHVVSAIPSMHLTDDLMMEYNVSFTKNLVAACEQRNCSQFGFTSSMAAYGNITTKFVSEKTSPQSPDAYGKSKLFGEEIFRSLGDKGHSCVAVRLPGIVGKNTKHNFLSKTAEKIKSNQPVVISNPETKFNNLAHIDDLARFFSDFLARKIDTTEPVFNFASKGHMIFEEIIKKMFEISKKEPNYSIAPASKDAFEIGIQKLESAGYLPFSTIHAVERFCIDVFQD